MSTHRQTTDVPRTRAPVEFDLFSSYGDDEEASGTGPKLSSDEQTMKRAIFGRNIDTSDRGGMFVKDNGRRHDEGSGSMIKPPVTVFPDIRAQYLVDKIEAVKDSVPPYERPGDLTKKFTRNELDRVLEWNDAHNRREERMWEDPEYAFVRQVQGLAADETLVTGPSGLPIGIDDDYEGFGLTGNTLDTPEDKKETKKRGSPDETGEAQGSSSKKGKGVSGGDVTVHDFDYADEDECRDGSITKRANGTRISKNILSSINADDIFVDEDVLDASRGLDRVRIMRNVQKQANKPSVSGVLRLSNKLTGAIRQSLLNLTERNYEKFRNKNRQHFYGDEHAMSLFASLTAANIALINIRAATTYYKDADDRRRKVERSNIVKQMDRDLVWSNAKGCFVLATKDERKFNRFRALMPPSLQWQFSS